MPDRRRLLRVGAACAPGLVLLFAPGLVLVAGLTAGLLGMGALLALRWVAGRRLELRACAREEDSGARLAA